MESSKESNPRISMIAAVAANQVIGAKNALIWRLPEDLKRFKKITSGHPVIMGRNTYLSLGRPLPKRTNVVITSSEEFAKQVPEGVIVAKNLMEALVMAPDLDEEEVFIIGGGRVYAEALGFSDRLYLTLLDQEFDGDVWFPEWREQFQNVIEEEEFEEGEVTGKYVILER
jgi:dihydrofolate reductase